MTADKAASPCLASRTPHFTDVIPEKLRQIEEAEAGLRDLGLAELRVRHHGEVARVELLPEDLMRAVHDPLHSRIHGVVTDAGFRFVALDLAGIQSGAFTLPLIGHARG